RSNQDDVLNISTSFFITNFPEQTTAKELWRLCKQYGNVIDVFIPNKRSKLGKRFGFVHFIKILDVVRLVNNVCTIWIGKFKLHVNIARFNRPLLNKGSHLFNPSANVKLASDASYKKVESRPSSSYIQAAKVGISFLSDAKALKPGLVLDDSCAHEPDLALSLVGWAPSFNDESDFDDESVDSQEASILKDEFSDKNSDMEEIPETEFDKSEHVENISPACNEVHMETRVEEKSEDSFNIYDMLNKKKPIKSVEHSDSNITYPPGFTPCDRPQETKMEKVDLFNIKACWGNINFNYVVSPSLGNSGGILCVWDPNLFYKENSTVSDYFIAIMGNWLPNNKNIWNGEVLLMRDFNEVRLKEERYGSIFNSRGAATFNSFIVDSGLVEVPSGGFSFTWSHRASASNPKKDLKNKLFNIDSLIDKGKVSLAILEDRLDTMNKLASLENMESSELAQKAKVKWSIEGDENSKFFHGIINKRRNNLAIRGAVWDCGLDKSQGPDGFTSGFYRRYLSLLEDEVVEAMNHFIIMVFVTKEMTRLSYVNGALRILLLSFEFLECFFGASGLCINLLKSKLMGVAVENSLVTSVANTIGCMTLSLPFSYLGVNVGGHMSRIASWDVVINKVLSRLSKWKMKVLYVGGRLTLLKLMLGSTPIYYMSLFKAPVQVINKLEAIRSHFFHGVDPSVGKMMLVKWNNVLASKEMGGLGVSSFYALNRALIFKWVWRFCTQGNSIWTKVIKALHGEEGNLDWPTTTKFPSNWLDIIRSFSNLYNKGVDLLGSIKKKVGSGENTMFWDELWKGEVLFKSLFPRLYALESVKNISI
nr:RNA-directed DNA polymerase, eukaryota [Tanacetum cinerariifolium]